MFSITAVTPEVHQANEDFRSANDFSYCSRYYTCCRIVPYAAPQIVAGASQMSLAIDQIAVGCIGLLHTVFAAGELYQWGSPKILLKVLQKWKLEQLSGPERKLMAMIVHNAGVYNGIVGAALFATLWCGAAAQPVQVTLLAGGIVAGLVGSVTLSKATIVQAIAGATAIILVLTRSS
jgi:uncharacterized membrane protein